ncbi:MAG: hypothetical protein ACXW31_12415 [Thermoanaerobaculia bacterium]
MTTDTIDDLLEYDIDDLTSRAAALGTDARNALLIAAADALSRPALTSRLKLLRFIQALAAPTEPSVGNPAVKAGVIALITAAHADDPTERLTALRALAVVASRAGELNLALTHSMLATFEHARIDSSSEIRAFANEILSADNSVFRQLISLEAVTAGAGKLGLYLETLIDSAHTVLDAAERGRDKKPGG